MEQEQEQEQEQDTQIVEIAVPSPVADGLQVLTFLTGVVYVIAADSKAIDPSTIMGVLNALEKQGVKAIGVFGGDLRNHSSKEAKEILELIANAEKEATDDIQRVG